MLKLFQTTAKVGTMMLSMHLVRSQETGDIVYSANLSDKGPLSLKIGYYRLDKKVLWFVNATAGRGDRANLSLTKEVRSPEQKIKVLSDDKLRGDARHLRRQNIKGWCTYIYEKGFQPQWDAALIKKENGKFYIGECGKNEMPLTCCSTHETGHSRVSNALKDGVLQGVTVLPNPFHLEARDDHRYVRFDDGEECFVDEKNVDIGQASHFMRVGDKFEAVSVECIFKAVMYEVLRKYVGKVRFARSNYSRREQDIHADTMEKITVGIPRIISQLEEKRSFHQRNYSTYGEELGNLEQRLAGAISAHKEISTTETHDVEIALERAKCKEQFFQDNIDRLRYETRRINEEIAGAQIEKRNTLKHKLQHLMEKMMYQLDKVPLSEISNRFEAQSKDLQAIGADAEDPELERKKKIQEALQKEHASHTRFLEDASRRVMEAEGDLKHIHKVSESAMQDVKEIEQNISQVENKRAYHLKEEHICDGQVKNQEWQIKQYLKILRESDMESRGDRYKTSKAEHQVVANFGWRNLSPSVTPRSEAEFDFDFPEEDVEAEAQDEEKHNSTEAKLPVLSLAEQFDAHRQNHDGPLVTPKAESDNASGVESDVETNSQGGSSMGNADNGSRAPTPPNVCESPKLETNDLRYWQPSDDEASRHQFVFFQDGKKIQGVPNDIQLESEDSEKIKAIRVLYACGSEFHCRIVSVADFESLKVERGTLDTYPRKLNTGTTIRQKLF